MNEIAQNAAMLFRKVSMILFTHKKTVDDGLQTVVHRPLSIVNS
jgi:hypothetical protein